MRKDMPENVQQMSHCLHYGGITARTITEWRVVARQPCPHCKRKGW